MTVQILASGGICRNWLILKVDRTPESWHTTVAPDCPKTQQVAISD
jgi:hypothetical protein